MEAHIAVAINTFNRKSSFYECYKSVTINTDTDNIFVVDDCSHENYFTSDYRFESRVGISKSKNMALQLCYESGADHIFLLDDDVRILKPDWWKPYVESGEHHLCATFLPNAGIFHKIKMSEPIFKYDNDIERHLITAKIETTTQSFKRHHLGNGYCLYFTRHCIETVGGFDTNYNNKYEHCDLSRSIFNAGLTKYMYQDVINSNELIYCLDQDNSIQRSFTEREMQQNLKDGYDYFRSQEKSSRYIEFRT
jgi:glycosyltransferase involved in cell wall biosynthesis